VWVEPTAERDPARQADQRAHCCARAGGLGRSGIDETTAQVERASHVATDARSAASLPSARVADTVRFYSVAG